jgi:hypothetical protein
MGGQGALASRARAVALKHLPAAPAGQAHEVGLAAAAREPAVGERVAELVRMQPVAEPRLAAALADDLGDPAVGHPALATDPKPRQIGMARSLPHPDVAVEGPHCLVVSPKRHLAQSAPLIRDRKDPPGDAVDPTWLSCSAMGRICLRRFSAFVCQSELADS